MDVGGGEAQRGTDLVGDDLDLLTELLTLVGLSGELLDAAGDQDAHALGQTQRQVLCRGLASLHA
jgi:hypothetical protein